MSWSVVRVIENGEKVVVATRPTEKQVISARRKLKALNPTGQFRIEAVDGTLMQQVGVGADAFLVPDTDIFG